MKKEDINNEEINRISIQNESKMGKDKKTINLNPKPKIERKKPFFDIPIIQINIKYYEKKSKLKCQNKKKEKSSNLVNIFSQNILKNNFNTINNNSNINKKSPNNLNNDKIFFYEPNNPNININKDENKSLSNKNVISDYMSTATSQNGKDCFQSDDAKSENNLKNNKFLSNYNQNCNVGNIYNQDLLAKQLQLINMQRFNGANNYKNIVGINNIRNFGLNNNMNNFQNMNNMNNMNNINNMNNMNLNYLNLISQMNNMNLLPNNFPMNNLNLNQMNNLNNLNMNNNYLNNLLYQNAMNNIYPLNVMNMNNMNLNNLNNCNNAINFGGLNKMNNLNNYNNCINNPNNINQINNIKNMNNANNDNINNISQMNNVNNTDNNILNIINKFNLNKQDGEVSIHFEENTPDGKKIYTVKYTSTSVKNNKEKDN